MVKKFGLKGRFNAPFVLAMDLAVIGVAYIMIKLLLLGVIYVPNVEVVVRGIMYISIVVLGLSLIMPFLFKEKAYSYYVGLVLVSSLYVLWKMSSLIQVGEFIPKDLLMYSITVTLITIVFALLFRFIESFSSMVKSFSESKAV